MKQNITLRIDKELIQKAKVISAQRQISISEMLSDELRKVIQVNEKYEVAKRRAINNLELGFHLGGRVATSREDLHETVRSAQRTNPLLNTPHPKDCSL